MLLMVTNYRRETKIAAIISIYSFLAALFVGYQSPAATYELDIYGSTPQLFWILISLPIFICVPIAIYRSINSKQPGIPLFVSVFSFLLIISIPLLRGYHHIGEGDMMTHLGFTRELQEGIISSTDLFYPAVHIFVVNIFHITGIEIKQIYLFLSVLFILSFIIFTGLIIRKEVSYKKGFTWGILTSMLLLPINVDATHLQPSPRNITVYLFPLMVFLFFLFIDENRKSFLILVCVGFVSYFYYHPQFAITLLFVLAVMLASYYMYDVYKKENRAKEIQSILILLPAFSLFAWIVITDETTFEAFIQSLTRYAIQGSDPSSGLSSSSVSLDALGVSLTELFLKIFFIPVIICIFVAADGIVLIKKAINKNNRLETSDLRYISLLAGLVPVAGFMIFFIAADRSNFIFRYQGFAMAIVTILGAITLCKLHNKYQGKLINIAIPLFIIALIMSILVVFPSPYVLNDSGHVTESKINGHETMFEYADPKRNSYDSIRSDTSRYGHAILGTEYIDRSEYYPLGFRRGGVPDHFNNQNLGQHYSDTVYLSVTTADQERDISMYDGFRFNEDDMNYLHRTNYINQVYSNSGVDFYHVVPAEGSE